VKQLPYDYEQEWSCSNLLGAWKEREIVPQYDLVNHSKARSDRLDEKVAGKQRNN